MYNSNVLKILKSFSKTELRELRKLVQSPYFNQREDVLTLFNYLAQHLGSAPILFEKEKIYAILYPNKRYDDAALRFTMHSLLKVIKQYLAQKEWEGNDIDVQLSLAKSMRKRGFDDYFEKEIVVSEAFINESPYRNADFHYMNYLLEIEKVDSITFARRKGEMPFKELFKALDSFYMAGLLRYGCASLYYKSTTFDKYQLPFLDAVIEWVSKNEEIYQNTEGVAIQIYFNAIMALKTNDSEFFFKLKNLINDNWMRFPDSECRVIYLQAINFCIRKINSNETQYLKEFFELMQSGLENKRLFENGVLSKFTYKNAVTVALKLEKFDWVKQFLEEYKNYLHPKDREASYHYNLAAFYLRQNDFDNALHFLQKIDTSDVLTNLDARSMLVTIYYDTKLIDTLYSLLDSFTTYINRQKDVIHLQNHYLNLIKYVKQLLKIDKKNEDEKIRLQLEIMDTKQVAEKEWLLDKLK
jgi:hypothetical protein